MEKSYWSLAILAIAAILIWVAVFAGEQDDCLRVSFFDVGQGAAVFIEAPNGNQILVDGGPSSAVLAKLGRAMPFYDRKIDLLILTHPDSDHLNGLIEVLDRYEIGQILETGIIDNTENYRIWQELVKEKNIKVIFARAGQMVKIADDLQFKILYPSASIAGQDFTGKTNNASIVGKLIYGENEFLLTGDAEKDTESILIFSGVNLAADILQVGHHGSKSSTSEQFLAAVAPRQAVIQVGKDNRYGHPTQEVLERLKNLQVWRNDLHGDVIFACDLAACAKK